MLAASFDQSYVDVTSGAGTRTRYFDKDGSNVYRSAGGIGSSLKKNAGGDWTESFPDGAAKRDGSSLCGECIPAVRPCGHKYERSTYQLLTSQPLGRTMQVALGIPCRPWRSCCAHARACAKFSVFSRREWGTLISANQHASGSGSLLGELGR
jgi:hypothetical protein